MTLARDGLVGGHRAVLLAGHLAEQGRAPVTVHGRGLLPGDRDRLGLGTRDRGRFGGPVLRRHGGRHLAGRLLVRERLAEGRLVGRWRAAGR